MGARNLTAALGFAVVAFVFFEARFFSDLRLLLSGARQTGIVRGKTQSSPRRGDDVRVESTLRVQVEGGPTVDVEASGFAWTRTLPGEEVRVVIEAKSGRALLVDGSSSAMRAELLAFAALVVAFLLSLGYAMGGDGLGPSSRSTSRRSAR